MITLDQLIGIMGEPMTSPSLQKFLEDNKIRFSKKLLNPVTNQSNGGTIYSDKHKLNLELDYPTWNPLYPSICAGKKGTFYLRLKEITLSWFPEELLTYLKINEDMDYSQLVEVLGEPVIEQLEYKWCAWNIPLHKEKDIIVQVAFRRETNVLSDLVRIQIPEKPVIDVMPNDCFLEAIGKPINAPEVKALLEKYEGSYPKKDKISTIPPPQEVFDKMTRIAREKVETQSFDIVLAGIDYGYLTFSLKTENPAYQPVPAKKENEFYPILTEISVSRHVIFKIGDYIKLPSGMNTESDYNDLVKKWGKPEKKKLHEQWTLLIDKEKDIVLEVMRGEDVIDQMVLKVRNHKIHTNIVEL